MTKIIKLFENGVVENGDRKFTRLVGGFNEKDVIISDLQIAQLLGYGKGARSVRQRISENIKHFEEGLHILDIAKRVPEQDTLKETLISLGYSKQSLTQAKNIYILSKAGFLLYLKFAEGEKAIEIYKDFLEDYFKTKAENESMKESIEITIEQLEEEKAMLYGKSVMAKTEEERLEISRMIERKNEQIIKLEKSKTQKEVIKKLESKIHIGELIENGKSDYDIGKFAKILNIKGLGRNKMFEWLKDEKLLMKDNVPYQQYVKYFSVIPVVNSNGYTNYKTLLKPKGVDYIMKRLIGKGKIVTKSVEDVLNELEGIA